MSTSKWSAKQFLAKIFQKEDSESLSTKSESASSSKQEATTKSDCDSKATTPPSILGNSLSSIFAGHQKDGLVEVAPEKMDRMVKSLLKSPVKEGELRYITNRRKIEAETNIHMLRDGVESNWSMQSPTSHPCGPYGWVTDILLSGFTGIRHKGEIYVYRSSTKNGDVPWKWC